jgi:hypothetical protein
VDEGYCWAITCGGAVMLRPVRVGCFGVWISTVLLVLLLPPPPPLFFYFFFFLFFFLSFQILGIYIIFPSPLQDMIFLLLGRNR